MKQSLLKWLRNFHLLLRKRRLPNRIAIYYHQVESRNLDALRKGLECLLSQGYVPVNATAYSAHEGPEKRLFVSFDDNFLDWYEALDVMDELGVKATFYVTSGVFHDRSTIAEQKDFMSRVCQPRSKKTLTVKQLREMVARGHTIGCHTHTHKRLSSLPRDRWDREIAHSKKVLERLIDQEVVDFSFPFGMRRDFSPELEAYCRNLGFTSIATGISGLLYVDKPDPFKLHRTGWKFEIPLADNIKNLHIDGRMYGTLFGRSVIG